MNQSGQSDNKAIIVIFVLAIVIVVPIAMYLRIPQGNNPDSKNLNEAELKNSLLAELQAVKALIADNDVDVTIVEKALDDFISAHGEDTTEANELQMLLDKRKEAQIQAAKLDSEAVERANEIKQSILNSGLSTEYIDSTIAEFSTNFGEDRKEIQELQRLLMERKSREEKDAERDEAIVSRAKVLITRINDDNEKLKPLQSAVSEFIIEYGDDRKEVPELRRLLEERKENSQREHSRAEEMIAGDAKKLGDRIKSKKENLNTLESELIEFVVRYGEDRKEIPELRQLIVERKEAERIQTRMTKDIEQIMERLEDPNLAIQDLEQLIDEFTKNYGESQDVVAEFERLLSARKEEKNREITIAHEVALLKSQISDPNHPSEELQKILEGFIRNYGESRPEVPELKLRLRERQERDLRNRFSKEAQNLMEQIKNKENNIDYLQSSFDRFIEDYGDSHNEIQELRKLLDDRHSEETILEILASLDAFVLAGNNKGINSIVSDSEYSHKLTVLSEWPGLIFRHQVEFFQREGDTAEVRVKLDNSAEHVPERSLNYIYNFSRDHGDWEIRISEKLDH